MTELQAEQNRDSGVDTIDDRFLDRLVRHIEEGRVVPIVGAELLVTRQNGVEVELYRLLAKNLAKELGVSSESLPVNFSLSDVAASYARRRDVDDARLEDVYSELQMVTERLELSVPEPLRKLASITGFNLFLSTTFDSLLEKAIDEVRFAGKECTESLAHDPTDATDLPPDWGKRRNPTVVHLLGKMSAGPNYVVTEADTVEFLCALQRDSGQLKNLFGELQGKHILVIGCGFPDWLARFFLRITKGTTFLESRAGREVIADSEAYRDKNLTVFLNTFSRSTRVFAGSGISFVDRLHAKWLARHPQNTEAAKTPASKAQSGSAPQIFISYAREDFSAAERLYEGLSARSDVWFDKRGGLDPGDLFDDRIIWNIQNCSLFIPVISHTTAEIREGYVVKEWNEARERLKMMKPGATFIVPVLIDDVPIEHAGIPAEFKRAQVTSLPGGEVTAAFLESIVNRLREIELQRRRR